MRDKGHQVTIAEVARAAGVSNGVVSTVLNGAKGTARTSAATRALVLDTAARLGYRPNRVAQSLRHGRTTTITLLVSSFAPYYADIATAAQAAATARGYAINVVSTNTAATELQALEYLRGGSSDGVIIGAGRHSPQDAVIAVLQDLRRRGVPAVLLHDRSPDPALPAIRIDNEAGAYLATAHLLRLGHRRIAHLTSEALLGRTLSAATDRYGGYRRALAEAGVAFDPAWLVRGAVSMTGGKEMIQALLARAGARPTAVTCYNDQAAIGALRALGELGVRVPEDIAVVGFDGLAFGAFTTPALTTVDFPRAALGRVAVETLFALFDGHDAIPTEQVLPVQLVVRESCGATAPAAVGREE
jgi:LacI family transcriptional regulator